jgi:hypothetical protein
VRDIKANGEAREIIAGPPRMSAVADESTRRNTAG